MRSWRPRSARHRRPAMIHARCAAQRRNLCATSLLLWLIASTVGACAGRGSATTPALRSKPSSADTLPVARVRADVSFRCLMTSPRCPPIGDTLIAWVRLRGTGIDIYFRGDTLDRHRHATRDTGWIDLETTGPVALSVTVKTRAGEVVATASARFLLAFDMARQINIQVGGSSPIPRKCCGWDGILSSPFLTEGPSPPDSLHVLWASNSVRRPHSRF